MKALDSVSISAEDGKIHSIVGENGAGKSTLMNVLMGIYQPDNGQIFYKGESVRIHSPVDAQKLGIGIVAQELNLVPNMSIAENITLGMFPLKKGVIKRVDNLRQIEIAQKTIDKLNPDIQVQQKAKSLSVANQQLVQIARVLSFGAELIIFDEPTASLTDKESEQLFKVIHELKDSGTTIFYISHRMNEIMALSDSISVMRDGCLIDTVSPESTTIDQLVSLMVGRALHKNERAVNESKVSNPIVFSVRNLTRKKEFTDVSFDLHEGEILGISGLVGSGRTELANAIFGMTSPDSGVMLLNGKEITHRHPKDAINHHIAYVPEERRQMGIIPLLSVAKNMALSHTSHYFHHGMIDDVQLNNDVSSYINSLGIKVSSNHQQIKNLSGGNQQKVIIARCLLAKSKIIILDEPTRGIDIQAKQEIHNLLRQLTETGVSIIVISSELEEILDISDRIMVMHEGEKKGEIEAQEATQEKLMHIALTAGENQ